VDGKSLLTFVLVLSKKDKDAKQHTGKIFHSGDLVRLPR